MLIVKTYEVMMPPIAGNHGESCMLMELSGHVPQKSWRAKSYLGSLYCGDDNPFLSIRYETLFKKDIASLVLHSNKLKLALFSTWLSMKVAVGWGWGGQFLAWVPIEVPLLLAPFALGWVQVHYQHGPTFLWVGGNVATPRSSSSWFWSTSGESVSVIWSMSISKRGS